MSLVDRAVVIVGITTRPDDAWMLQAGRHVTDCEILDSGTKVIQLPPRSPNLNAYAERFVPSIKEECLNRMIFVGQASLRRAVREFVEHYHEEPNHQGSRQSIDSVSETSGCKRW